MTEWFIYGLCNLPAFAVFAWILKNLPKPDTTSRGEAVVICSILFLLGPIGTAAALIVITFALVDLLNTPHRFVKLKEWLKKDLL